MSRYFIDRFTNIWFFIFGIVSFLILFIIFTFIFTQAFPAFWELRLDLFGTEWYPTWGIFGILPLIVGSIVTTVLALVIAFPLSLGCAIFLAELAPPRVYGFSRLAVELLVGIPSVVYGLIGLVLLIPLIAEVGGGAGPSVLAAGIVLAVMIIPTLATISEDSIKSVPIRYKEAALALGATHWQAIWRVLLPAARSGIAAAIILSLGRAIGETMAVIMVIGNSPIFPTSLFDPVRALTGNIALELLYAPPGIHQSALFACAVVLFTVVMLMNGVGYLLYRRGRVK